jgi:hypothetical protein
MLGLPASTIGAVLFVWIAGYSRHLFQGVTSCRLGSKQMHEYGDFSMRSRRRILILALPGFVRAVCCESVKCQERVYNRKGASCKSVEQSVVPTNQLPDVAKISMVTGRNC